MFLSKKIVSPKHILLIQKMHQNKAIFTLLIIIAIFIGQLAAQPNHPAYTFHDFLQ